MTTIIDLPPIVLDPGAGNVLGSTEILRGIGNSTLRAIAAAAMQKMVEEGETLYSVGDPVNQRYMWSRPVAYGSFSEAMAGRRLRARSFAPVTFSAWAALLGDQPRRIATVMALEECRLFEIEGEALLGILERDPCLRLSRHAASRPDDHAKLLEQSALLKGAT